MIKLLIFVMLSGCGGLVPKKYAKRSEGETFYDFKPEIGAVFDSYCKRNDCDEHDITPKNLGDIEDWRFFQHGNFIIIKEKYCF